LFHIDETFFGQRISKYESLHGFILISRVLCSLAVAPSMTDGQFKYNKITTLSDRRLRALTMLAGTSSSREEFLKLATRALQLGLGCMAVCVAEASEDRKRVQILTLYMQGEYKEPYSYDLAGTPCEKIYTSTENEPHILYCNDLCQLFPTDEALIKIGAQSYRAEAFDNSDGVRMGHVFIIDNKPMDESTEDEAFFRLVSQRIGSEINRWHTEEILSQDKEYFQTLAEIGNDWFWKTDSNHKFVAASDPLKDNWILDDIVGVSRWDNASPRDLMDKEKWTRHKKTLDNHQEFQNFEFELNINPPEWVSVSGKPIFDETGGFIGHHGIATVITRRIQAEKKSKFNETRFREFAQCSSDWFWETDKQGRIIWEIVSGKNKYEKGGDLAFSSLKGKTRQEIAGDLRTRTNWEPYQQALDERRAIESFEYCYYGDEGDIRHALIDGQPMVNDAGEYAGYRGAGTDISERKRSEAELARHRDNLQELVQEKTKELLFSKEAAEKASKVKSDFLASMSHEFRTPLNAIIGFSSAMKEEVFGPLQNTKYKEYVEDILSSGQHLHILINDLLDISAIEAGKIELNEETVSVPDLVGSSVNLLKDFAQKEGVNLRTEIPEELPMLCLDQRRGKQILYNLLSNAIKFTVEGGTVIVTAQHEKNNGLILTITDTGIGMDEKEIIKALTIFEQVDSVLERRYEGTGLGLPLTKELIELHNGRLVITSQKGQGTSATVIFPNDRVLDE